MLRKNIMVMQIWQQQLGHNIFYGILDYLADHNRKDIKAHRIPWSFEELQQQGHTYRVDGFIAPIITDEAYRVLSSMDWKCVSTHIGVSWPNIPRVDADHFKTGRMAAEYLLNQGFESFAYFGESTLHAIRMRKDGFMARLRESGLSAQIFEYKIIVQKPDTLKITVEDWINQLPVPTAVYCSDDSAASDLLFYCHQNNIHVPDQIAILGTEDSEGLCDCAHPPLSSVHIPYRKIGYEAMRIMVEWLETGHMPVADTVLPPDYISARASTDTLAIEDEQLRKSVRLLRDHCTEKISMDEIARKSGMSLRVMQSKFKTQIGHSPLAELHKARIEQVKQMLRKTPFTLDEIADKTGYPNANYLCEHFKKITALSPGEYRRATQRIAH